MIDAAGPYILVLVFSAYNRGGVAMHEMPNFESCKAAISQLEPTRGLSGYCIAKNVKGDSQ